MIKDDDKTALIVQQIIPPFYDKIQEFGSWKKNVFRVSIVQ